MNLTQLRAFHLVARAGGFTRAAEAAHVSQPTLSTQVKALEETYRVRLFERRGRRLIVTPLGQTLADLAGRLFTLEDEARALLTDTQALARGHLRVWADSAYHAIPILAALRARHAGLTFSLRIANSAAVVRALFDYDAEVAVTAAVTSDPRLHARRIRGDRLVAFVPRRHALARRRALALADLAGRDLVLRERGSTTREAFERALAAALVVPGAIVEVETREAVREAVAAGFGIGVVFDSEFGNDPRFARLRLEGGGLEVAEYAACLDERRELALVRAFMDAAAP